MAKNNKQAFVNAVRAKGGAKYMAIGGPTTPTLAPQATQQGNNLAAGAGTIATPFATLNPATAFNAVGQVAQGIAQDFTAQNDYQAQLAPTTNLDYTGVIGNAAQNAQAGYGQLQGNIANEQALQQQLGQQALGQGPNPAQAALSNATGQNVANQAALAAGQRGAAGNVGLMQRNVAQQGANTQQQAVGQAALMQAQQQLAAQQGQAALQGQIGNQITNEQAANNQLFGAGAGAQNTQNANLVSNYNMAQGINSGIAQNNANAVNQTMGGVLQGASSLLSIFADGGKVPTAAEQGAMAGAQAGEQAGDPTPKPLVSMDYTTGIDWAPPRYADGGPVSFAGQYLNASPSEMGNFGAISTGQSAPMTTSSLPGTTDSGKAKAGQQMGKAATSAIKSGGGFNSAGFQAGTGSIPGQTINYTDTSTPSSMNSPGVDFVSDQSGMTSSIPGGGATAGAVSGSFAGTGANSLQFAKGGSAKKPVVGEQLAAKGMKVPGKANVPGKDTLKNDTVPAMLSPGEIVIPKSIAEAHDAPQKAMAFVQAIQAKQGLKRGKRG